MSFANFTPVEPYVSPEEKERLHKESLANQAKIARKGVIERTQRLVADKLAYFQHKVEWTTVSDWQAGSCVVINKVDGVSVTVSVEDTRSPGYLRVDSGKKVAKVSVRYGNKATYPQNKDGGFNYTGIAERISLEVKAAKYKNDAEAEKKAKYADGRKHFKSLAEKYGTDDKLSEYAREFAFNTGVVRGRVLLSDYGSVSVAVAPENPDEVDAIMDALLAIK